jgi:hypothetical protein
MGVIPDKVWIAILESILGIEKPVIRPSSRAQLVFAPASSIDHIAACIMIWIT